MRISLVCSSLLTSIAMLLLQQQQQQQQWQRGTGDGIKGYRDTSSSGRGRKAKERRGEE